MKLKDILCIGLGSLFACGCSENYTSFEGTNRIQFKTKTDEVYTFAYFPESKQTDTINVEIMTIGEVVDYSRKIRFEQITKEWEYKYDEENSKKVIDSSYVDMKFPAVAGVHFEVFGENNEVTLPANQNVLNVKVIIKRSDAGLQKNAYKLVIHLLPSQDFGIGELSKLTKSITISDKLERPVRWKDSNYYCKLYIGSWSERKHRFMIDVTEQTWDNDFVYKIITSNNSDYWSLRNYYVAKLKMALVDYNANPANNPPMKDENGNVVVFP